MIKSETIDRAIEVINYAIKNQITVKEASVKCGYADTYVKNVRAVVYENYNKGTIDDEQFNKLDELYKKYTKGDSMFPTLTVGSNRPEDLPLTNNEKTTLTVNGDNAVVEWVSGANYPPNHIKTLDGLLKETNIDTEIWKVKDFVVNKWDVTSFKNDFPATIENFQVKARLEKDIKASRERIAGEAFIEMTKNYKAPVLHVTPKNPSAVKQNNIFEITIFDLHLGKLAWGGETGEDYDTKIARTRFLDCIETLIGNARGFEYSRILFPIGSDFFNSDTILNTTTKGTPQDEDLRWQKTFDVGTKLMIDAIEMLKQTGVPIDILVIPGNHDMERSFYLGWALHAWFRDDKQVNIDNGASPRKFYRFGKVLLGFSHGSEEKESALPLIMASDIMSKPMWSETIYHEWHLGHIHRKRDVKFAVLDKNRITNEDLGVTVRYLSSLTGTEEWHHRKGFIGAIKAGESFIWNDEAGMIAHLNSNLVIK